LSTKECFEEVKKFLTVGKLQQAAEKCWFGTSTALENLADRSRKGLVLPTHHSKNVFRYFVSSQLPAGGSLSKETFNDKYRVAES
jgi:hypothetical protein